MKNIVILADGTWNNEKKASLTNIAKLDFALKKAGLHDSEEQVVIYHDGVGADGDKLEQDWEGATGHGIEHNIRYLYKHLVEAYEPGDKIFIFGFSRGAATARYLTDMIRDVYILKKENSKLVREAYDKYTADKKFDQPNVVKFRKQYSYQDNTVSFLGVFDTVESIFDPEVVFEKRNLKDVLPDNVLVARHALALDEKREDFYPSLWQPRPGVDSMQRWFAGVHCDVGGSYQHHGLADGAYVWMLSEAKRSGLILPKRYLNVRRVSKVVPNDEHSDIDSAQPGKPGFAVYLEDQMDIKPNPFDKKHNSYKGLFSWLGKKHRVVGEQPDEVIDPSIKERMENKDCHYKPKNLPLNQKTRSASGGFWAQNQKRINHLEKNNDYQNSYDSQSDSGYSDDYENSYGESYSYS